jgi:lipoprotein-releasing system permease protein
MLGVAALIVVMSVMNGFRAELFDKIVGLNGHAVIQGYGGRLENWQEIARQARTVPGITAAVPLIEQPLMASHEGRVEGVLVRGMRRQDILTNPTLQGKVLSGSLEALQPGQDKVAIGVRLAEALGATVGGSITIISPQGQTTPFGTVPRIVDYEVAAIFEVGVFDYDKAFVVMPIEDAQTLLFMGDAVGMVEIETEDAERVGEIMAPLARDLGGRAIVADWRNMNASLFEALAVERVAMFVVLSLIILVAVFNILSSLIMLVRAKTRDIAILRTMGATRQGLIKVFVTVGVTIGALGTIAGLLLGALFLFFRQGVVNFIQLVTGQNLWDPSIRFLTELPAKTDPLEVIAVTIMALGLSFLATLYPAWKAASTDPVQVLRYE